jgi:predicted RNA-binding Zn ribbon-like protein
MVVASSVVAASEVAASEVAASEQKQAREAAIGPAPGRLELVRAFVNTLDIEAGTDELSSPSGLDHWLAGHGLTAQVPAQHPSHPAGQHDLQQAIATREALRDILASHAPGQGHAQAAADRLRPVAAALPARLAVGADGAVRAAPGGAGPAAGLAELLLIAAEATTTGTWSRLKVCGADDCRWAFYDRSPARSGCWCSMAICGSRAKSRAFRRRSATTRRPAGRPAGSAGS